MAEKYKREIELKNDKIKKLVEKKQALTLEGRELNKEVEKIVKQHEKMVNKLSEIASKIRKIQLKIIPLVRKEVEKDLAEFEIPITTEIKDGKLILIIEDALEEWKARFKSVDKFEKPVPLKNKKKK